MDLQSLSEELKILYDAASEERKDVGVARKFEPGNKLFGGCSASDLRPSFEHDDVFARLGEVIGGDEAVVTGADDHSVVNVFWFHSPN